MKYLIIGLLLLTGCTKHWTHESCVAYIKEESSYYLLEGKDKTQADETIFRLCIQNDNDGKAILEKYDMLKKGAM